VRVSFENNSGSPRIVQENHYYPYGMIMSGIAINTPVPTTANKFLGNGRELQDDFSVDPNYFSTYFREYDLVLGRFNGIDPLAASFDMYSPQLIIMLTMTR